MSRSNKPLTLARLEDLTLGSFVFVPSSETIDHLVRYLSTWSGSDKLFMLIQYSIKVIVPFLQLRARVQHRAGTRKEAVSSAATGLTKFASLIGDARMLMNIWGLLPIFRWLTSLERNPPPTRKLLTIERLQGWSMLAYYPLEHLYYLLAHSIIPSQLPRPSLSSILPLPKSEEPKKPINLDAGLISRVSTRFWALYVVLQLAHLREDSRLLKLRERALNKSKAEKEELKNRWDALRSEVIVNLAYLPLTIHWSIESGLFQNDFWVGLFGLIAGLASWRSGWRATALPPTAPPASEVPPLTEESEKIAVDDYLPAAEDTPDVDILTPSELTDVNEATDSAQ